MSETEKKKLEESFWICQQCGQCTSACSSSQVSDYNARRLVRRVQLDMTDEKEFLEKYPWLCTQCGRCHEICGAGLDIPKMVIELRRKANKAGFAPAAVKTVSESIQKTNSPFKSGTRTKGSWLKEPLKASNGAEVLYWAGCAPGIMAPNIAKATAEVLDRVAGGFQVLSDEPCCGEPLIVLGLTEEARENALKVVKAVSDSGAKIVVTSCAGCFNTLTNLYPNVLGVKVPEGVQIMHFAQFIASRKPALKLEKPMTVAYHDPCSLGRHSKVYDPPRDVLKSIEGLTLKELTPHKDRSLCCGGGGGMWSVDSNLAMEMANAKFERSILPAKVEVLVSACPTCYLNFRFTFLKRKLPVTVMDLAEVVNQALPK